MPILGCVDKLGRAGELEGEELESWRGFEGSVKLEDSSGKSRPYIPFRGHCPPSAWWCRTVTSGCMPPKVAAHSMGQWGPSRMSEPK